MAKNRWFKFFPSDFLAGVRSLTPIEITAYIVVLCELYDNEGWARRDDEHFARACLIRKTDLTRAMDALIAKGKLTCEDGILTNKRVSEEIGKRAIAATTKAQQRRERDVTETQTRREASGLFNKIKAATSNVQPYKEERIQNNTTLKVADTSQEVALASAKSPALAGFIKRREMFRRREH